jgi:hypothetical protein
MESFAQYLCYTFIVQGVHMGKNVTLRLDESIIRQARHEAVECDQSLSEWLAELIVQTVSQKNRFHSAREKALQKLHRGFHLGGKPLSRDETHER